MDSSLALRSRHHRPRGETPTWRTRQNGPMTSLNSFGSKMTLNVQGRELTYYSLRADALSALGVDRLPYCIKVLLENLLRHEDGVKVNAADIEALARWGENPSRHGEAAGDDAKEIAFTPERVLMQDLTGVPAVVDLASMRDAIIALGGDPNKINPLVPVELVIDHSVIIERSGTAESFEQNVAIEYERNVERYTFLKWAQSSFEKFRVVPPGMGICHQVNLEHLARVVFFVDARHNRQHVTGIRRDVRDLPDRPTDHRLPRLHRSTEGAARPRRGVRQGPGNLARPRRARADLLRVRRTRPHHSRAEPRRAQATAGPRVAFRCAWRVPQRPRAYPPGSSRRRDGRDIARRRGRRRGDHVVHQHLQPVGVGGGRARGQARGRTRAEREALGQDLARPGKSRRHGLPRARRSREAARRSGFLSRRLRLHDVHRQHRSLVGRGLRSRQRARSFGRIGAVR